MEDNDETVCDKMFEEIDVPVKIEPHSIQQIEEDSMTYYNLNIESPKVPTMEECHPIVSKARRGRGSKRSLETKSQATILKPNYSTTAEPMLGLKYRPIRPKPAPSNISKNKLFEISSTINESALNSLVATTSTADKDGIRDVTVVSDNSDGKTINYIKHIVNSNIGSIAAVTKEINDDTSMMESSDTMTANKKKSCNSVAPARSKSSIELFFESMAQAVMNLPMEIQAEIKMEICRLVTMAEIKYCGAQSEHKTS